MDRPSDAWQNGATPIEPPTAVEAPAPIEPASPVEPADSVEPSTMVEPAIATTPPERAENVERAEDPDSREMRRRRKARAIAMFALMGLVIMGFGMVALTWLGFRMTRRYMFGDTGSPKPLRPSGQFGDDWAQTPLPRDHGNDGDASSPRDSEA